MLPSAFYWDLVGSSALLNLPAAPGFGNLGKSFLIENLLRAGAPSPAQLRPLPASPVPLKLCPAAEQINPSGGPFPARWAFQVLNPCAADGGRPPARAAAAERGGIFPPAATGERRARPVPSRRWEKGLRGFPRARPLAPHGGDGGSSGAAAPRSLQAADAEPRWVPCGGGCPRGSGRGSRPTASSGTPAHLWVQRARQSPAMVLLNSPNRSSSRS